MDYLVGGQTVANLGELVKWTQRLKDAQVLVLGDVILDKFQEGVISRISPEAPVAILKQVKSHLDLGGAGNVVNNLHSLGAQVSFVSVIGADPEGDTIQELLTELDQVDTHLVSDESRKTTIKTRFLADHQQVLRVDNETTHPLSQKIRDDVISAINEKIRNCDVAVLSDYGKGFFDPSIIEKIISIARLVGVPVIVDPKGNDYTRYAGASVITPNLKELEEATLLTVDDDGSIIKAARKLIDMCGLEAVLVTKSQRGMTLVLLDGRVSHFRSEAKEVYDVSGAGDTVISTVAAALGAGADLLDAAGLSNVAAGIVVSKAGTAVVYPSELIQALHHQEMSGAERKVMDLQSAMRITAEWRRKGFKVGFTNGFFELLQPVHIRLLAGARDVCDKLVVGINSDESVLRLKGKSSVLHETARSTILASLENVDAVVGFHEDTPLGLIEHLQPDVLIKGGNYRLDEVIGADKVQGYGGKIVVVEIDPSDPGFDPKLARLSEGSL